MPSPGLCASCTYARTIQNDRGSVFWLCEASKFNPRLAKYPRLPVLTCEEYQKATHPQSGSGELSEQNDQT